MEEINVIFQLICSSKKLERDRGIVQLEKLLPKTSLSTRHSFQEHLLNMMNGGSMSSAGGTWEIRHGCLHSAKCLIPHMTTEDETDCQTMMSIKQTALKLVSDPELRVRLGAGEVLGRLCQVMGYEVYEEARDNILKLIRINLEKNIVEEESSSRLEQFETERLVQKLIGPSAANEGSGSEVAQTFHDTAGWKNLETSLKALQAMVEGCGIHFQQFIDEELLSLVFKTLNHRNRFVRETGFYVCSSLISCGNSNEEAELEDTICHVNPVYLFGHDFTNYLADGLADNWPQVRLSASVAARELLLTLPSEEARQAFYPQLLPRMCLNRYYAADGVRIYSQETWRQIMGAKGKHLVEKYIGVTVEYYIEATKSDNHAVREAACACIAELASKISGEAVRPHVDQLLSTLLNCFHDDSWPVRDAGCLACGSFIVCYPEEARPLLEAMYPMFCRNLADPIPSVRQGAANALCNVVRAYGYDAMLMVFGYIETGLENIKTQSSEPERTIEVERVGLKRVLSDESHTDRQMCRSGVGGGAIQRRRESQPWELADGCAHLLAELSYVPECATTVAATLPRLMAATRLHHYANHVVLLETVCKHIPVLAKNLGKKIFKHFLDDMLDVIFYALECENALTCSAASQCVSQLATFIGHNVLRARVNNFNPRYLQHLESAVYIAPL